jgi:DNA-binding MarR family transcriptional regulator
VPARGLKSDRRAPGDEARAAADHVAMARALLFQGELRRSIFPGLLRQPAWDMLLAAYVAAHESIELTPAALCAYSGEPAAQACRWLRRMEQEGLVRRRRGRSDAAIVLITKSAATRLQQLLKDLLSQSTDSTQPA